MGRKRCLVGVGAELSGSVKCEERKTTLVPSKASNDFQMPIRGEGNFWGKRGVSAAGSEAASLGLLQRVRSSKWRGSDCRGE